MSLSPALLSDLTAALADQGRTDLISRLRSEAGSPPALLTSGQAASMLGVSAGTAKNWLEGGFFPGAFQTAGGHWRFPKKEVEKTLKRMTQIRERNRRGELRGVDDVDEDKLPPPPLL